MKEEEKKEQVERARIAREEKKRQLEDQRLRKKEELKKAKEEKKKGKGKGKKEEEQVEEEEDDGELDPDKELSKYLDPLLKKIRSDKIDFSDPKAHSTIDQGQLVCGSRLWAALNHDSWRIREAAG